MDYMGKCVWVYWCEDVKIWRGTHVVHVARGQDYGIYWKDRLYGIITMITYQYYEDTCAIQGELKYNWL